MAKYTCVYCNTPFGEADEPGVFVSMCACYTNAGLTMGDKVLLLECMAGILEIFASPNPTNVGVNDHVRRMKEILAGAFSERLPVSRT